MIGIDVIDLKDPLLKSREKATRFIEHPEDNCPEFENNFWILWSAKEAIFKTKRELKPFDPKQIRVTVFMTGDQIHFYSGDISGEVIVESERITSIAQVSNNLSSYRIIEKKTTNESEEVRNRITEHFAKEKLIQIVVSKDTHGLPQLDYRKIPISISHHGRFLSFAYPSF